MQFEDETWVQTADGLWMPKRHLAQNVRQTPQDWSVHWKAHGQSWRTEPEISRERQQFLLNRLKIEPDELQGIYPFEGVALTRADVEWLIEKQEEEQGLRRKDEDGRQNRLALAGACLNAVDLRHLSLKEAGFWSAQLEGAIFEYAELEGADFGSAELKGANFRSAKLKGANFRSAKLEGADFRSAKLEGADFWSAKLEGANFGSAELEGANFGSAKLKGADFMYAKLEGAYFWAAELEGADFMYARLQGTSFEDARLDRTIFRKASFVDAQGTGPSFANAIGWDTVFLDHIEWSSIKYFAEDVEARKKLDKEKRIKAPWVRTQDYHVAALTYRQLATALEGQGLKEEAERFAYRAQVMQRKVLWWRVWDKERTFWQRVSDGRGYLFSWLLALLTGYGYRFGRSLVSYLCVLLTFALVYLHISQGTAHPLGWLDAAVLSISDMVGRGFFRQDVTLSDPYALWSVLEGMIGVFMDVLLISTLTQRLFKK